MGCGPVPPENGVGKQSKRHKQGKEERLVPTPADVFPVFEGLSPVKTRVRLILQLLA